MMLRRELGLALAAVMAAAGCAPMTTSPAKPASAAVPPAATTSPATRAETAPAVAPAGTAIDTTTPSSQAERVLARIPEPLTPAQQALSPVQDTMRTRGTAVAPAAAYDSLQAAPVPATTQPLGTQTSTVTTSESVATSPSAAATPPAGGTTSGAAGAAAAGGAAAGSAAGGTTPGTASAGEKSPCWRLQVAAPLESEKEKADGRVEAAQSLLMVPFTIVPEKGYLKVRTSDCMTREAADALKKRAVESGFDGAFLVDTSARPAPAPAPKHQHVPASKRKR